MELLRFAGFSERWTGEVRSLIGEVRSCVTICKLPFWDGSSFFCGRIERGNVELRETLAGAEERQKRAAENGHKAVRQKKAASGWNSHSLLEPQGDVLYEVLPCALHPEMSGQIVKQRDKFATMRALGVECGCITRIRES
jgi:hypothetical protein